MSEQRSKRKVTEDVAHVDSLLSLLGDLSKRDPSPALRERLGVLATERLNQNPRHVGSRSRTWLRPAIAAAFLITAGLATGLWVHFFEREPIQSTGTAKATAPVVSPRTATRSLPSVRPSVSRVSKVHHAKPTSAEPTAPRQMTMRLPYSNSAIETGTGTTIRVSMTQSELLSLGFPINETVQDRRIVAELTLGDDGLPRAISLPLPLEVMKERK